MATVLVVDDLPQVRRLIRFTVESLGHRALEAGDGRDGWRLLTTERADLVILDVDMPGPSGLDVSRSIRADARLADLPIIILTGNGQHSAEDAAAAGASAYLSKPFRPAELLDLVATFAGAP